MASTVDTTPAPKLRVVQPDTLRPRRGRSTRCRGPAGRRGHRRPAAARPRDGVRFGRVARSARAARERRPRGRAREGLGWTLGVEPARGDWRFKDPTWRENPVYRRVGQSYLAASRALEGIIDAEDLDWKTAERARLLVSILTSAAAPTNTVAGNPAALKRALRDRRQEPGARRAQLRPRRSPQRRHAVAGRHAAVP